jgi:hypothetical protein
MKQKIPMNEAKLTARFKTTTSFVVEETQVDFDGVHTKSRITNVKAEIDFAASRLNAPTALP